MTILYPKGSCPIHFPQQIEGILNKHCCFVANFGICSQYPRDLRLGRRIDRRSDGSDRPLALYVLTFHKKDNRYMRGNRCI